MLVGCYDSTELPSVGAVKIVSTWYGLTLPACVPACQGLHYRYAILVSWYTYPLPIPTPAPPSALRSGSKGREDAHGRPNPFNFMKFSGQVWQNLVLALPGGLAPHLGEILDPPLVLKWLASGWYESCWNAFFFSLIFVVVQYEYQTGFSMSPPEVMPQYEGTFTIVFKWPL